MNNLQKRVVSSLIMVILFGSAVYVHHIGMFLTFGLMAFLTTTEYIAMVKPGNRMFLPAASAVLIYCLLYIATTKVNLNYFLIFLGLVSIYHSYILIELLLVKSNRALRSYVPGVIYLALASASVHYFQYYDLYQKDIFILLALIWASDTGSYFIGRHFGKTPLAPKISPNKTREGFIGGLVLSLLFSSVLVFLNVLDARLYIIAVIVHFLVVLGDLIESKLKRLTQVKDSSHLIPGHGGFLDRCDGLLFAFPFVILLYHYIFNQ